MFELSDLMEDVFHGFEFKKKGKTNYVVVIALGFFQIKGSYHRYGCNVLALTNSRNYDWYASMWV